MKKHLKIFLTTIVLTFSFCFVSKVKAFEIQNVEINDNFMLQGWKIIEANTNFSKVDYPYASCWYTPNDNYIACVFYKSNMARQFNPNDQNSYRLDWEYGNGINLPCFSYSLTNDIFGLGTWVNNRNYDNTGMPSNTNIYNTNGEKIKTKSFNYDSSYYGNVSFHLNGGTIWTNGNNSVPYSAFNFDENFYTGIDLNDFINSHNLTRTGSVFQGWYYDKNFTRPYNSENPFNITETCEESNTFDPTKIKEETIRNITKSVFGESITNNLFSNNYFRYVDVYLQDGKYHSNIYFFTQTSLTLNNLNPNVNGVGMSGTKLTGYAIWWNFSDNTLDGYMDNVNSNIGLFYDNTTFPMISPFDNTRTFFATYSDNLTITNKTTHFLDFYSCNIPTYKDIDLYAKFDSTIHTFNFHLNGGWVYDPTDDWGEEEDFSFSLYQNEIEQFFSTLEVHKYMMLFEGWYYDPNFTQPFTINDTITSDVDLYAKYRYERVDDFLSNTTLNEHTFDTSYSYAIINRGDNGNSVYIGLPFEIYNLEVYEYIESEYKVKDGSSACPVPLYNKNGYFYYDINTLFTNNQEVLILPRALFEALDPNDFEDPNDVYKFYLTDNAYISYTNDLSEAQIVDSNGETISINLQNSYELSQQYQELYSNPENIFNQMNIFLEKMKKTTGAIKEIFGYLFNSLNSTIKSFIIFIIVVILITTIIRFSRRG